MIAAALRLGGALSGLAGYRQFILYKTVWNAAKQKFDKFPTSPYSGLVIDAHDRTQWVDSESALLAAEAWGQHVAFVLSETDPFWFLDIDGAYRDNRWSDLANSLIAYFPGAAVEVSQSGTGLHIFGQGRAPAHGCKNAGLGLEFYTEKRFVALTGTHASGTTALDWTAHLSQLIPAYFPIREAANPAAWTTEPMAEWRGPLDDDELILRMLRTRPSAGAAFGEKASFSDLWHADPDALARALPASGSPGSYDASTADFNLALHLSWWTGGNCERVERLMRRSALAREKWDTHATYLREFTITKAVAACRGCYVEPPTTGLMTTAQRAESVAVPVSVAAPVGTKLMTPRTRGGVKFLDPAQQMDYFAGCVYVKELDKVIVPNGMMLDSPRFNSTYGGYLFKLDDANTKVTNKPWEAFVMSLAFEKPIVDRTYFNPNHEPRAVTERFGVTSINTWMPKFGDRIRGDATPFVEHIAKLLPDQNDQRILLAYMAACVQNPGVKFQWAVVLQGVEGNGKSMIAECLNYALGDEYVHSARASQLASDKFNSWMDGKLLIVVNDFKSDPRAAEDVMEVLKPMISDRRQPIRGMQTAEATREVFCNYLFTMNSPDGLRKTKNDRRYAVFFTDQQSEDDLERAGMGSGYFRALRKWLDNGGFGIVADYLATVTIPAELNPANGCHRAPRTSRLGEVLQAGLSGQAQMIVEAIAEGRVGLQGGYLSGAVVKAVLCESGMKWVGPKALGRIMDELGYQPHPKTQDGRFPRLFPWDQGVRPIVYVKPGHLSENFVTVDAVLADYAKHQAVASLSEATARFAQG